MSGLDAAPWRASGRNRADDAKRDPAPSADPGDPDGKG